MAESTKKPSNAVVAEIKVRCVQRYGGHAVGDAIMVTQREYDRLRAPVLNEQTGKPTGRYRYPVLITDEHQREQDREDRERREAEERERRGVTDAADSIEWAKMQEQAREILDAKAIEAQKRLREKVTDEATDAKSAG